MQTFAEKCAAIESLLPLLHIHLDYLPQAVRVSRYGDADQYPGAPRPAWATADCDGRCGWCEYRKVCRGEWWEVVREKLRRRYRLVAIELSLRKLELILPRAARAIYALYVYELGESGPLVDERLRQWARKGIEWMAQEIPGEVPHFGERRREKKALIRELLEQGYTYRVITATVRCSRREIAEVSRAFKARQERTVSASS